MPLAACLDCPNLPASEGVFSVSGEARIARSADQVFAILIEWSKHPEWDTFTQTISFKRDGLPAIGDRAVMHVKMAPSAPAIVYTPLEVTYVSAEERKIAWKSRLAPSFLLRTERVLVVIPDGPDACIFRTWETQAGPMAHVVRLRSSRVDADIRQVKAATGGALDRGFDRVAADLKRRAESS